MTKISKYSVLFLIFPVFVFGQKKTFEIFGNITGEYKDKIYFFYENGFSQKDSISAAIKNGKFYFREKAVLPILCRFHFGEKTDVKDLYIDNDKTVISINSNLVEKDTPDSLGGARTHFEIVTVKGSKTQNIVGSFQTWKRQSQKINQSNGRKASEYFAELQTIVTKYPKSKASAYLIAGRGFLIGSRFMLQEEFPLHYNEVNELKSLLDTSLNDTYEWQNISGLLNKLKKGENRTINSTFYNVTLKDTSGKNIDTKDFSNRFVLIDFWASWCKPCRALNPELKILYDKYKQKGFEILVSCHTFIDG